MRSQPGVVYLLHFEQPYKHARHYLGYTAGELAERLREHQSGTGARIMAVVAGAGIAFTLVRTWAGTRKTERRLKKGGSSTRYCPTCSPHPRPTRFAPEATAS